MHIDADASKYTLSLWIYSVQCVSISQHSLSCSISSFRNGLAGRVLCLQSRSYFLCVKGVELHFVISIVLLVFLLCRRSTRCQTSSTPAWWSDVWLSSWIRPKEAPWASSCQSTRSRSTRLSPQPLWKLAWWEKKLARWWNVCHAVFVINHTKSHLSILWHRRSWVGV